MASVIRRISNVSKTVTIVLQNDVPKLGLRGDLVKVRAGFARNYLCPQKLAVYASASNLAKIASERASEEAIFQAGRRAAEEASSKIGKLQLSFKRHSNDGQTLYGSVTAQDIAQAIEDKVSLGLSKLTRAPLKVNLEQPIKNVGTHDVGVEFQGKQVTVKVAVAKR
ncbi:mitochondrial ribosomal protein L9 (bL9m) [Andalucia godoyi]|uniref:50S ribosomal protein L9, chloroplastic n=1 Tax=Andalucia godoyi TaxID=505711 RepID=A0A8K0AHE6_ANDGO|nr:mitochondrial ribosomal protein L9 (bL9m) [Andalucia godoyi]|eukprot:ANDGO_06194.mRNA.1 mitochondrial ribosomal protein L9 (bL9m)